MSNPKLIIHWWEDSSGRITCHKNEKGLTSDQSLVGCLEHDKDGKWWIRFNNSDTMKGPYKDMYAARKALETELNAASIDSTM